MTHLLSCRFHYIGDKGGCLGEPWHEECPPYSDRYGLLSRAYVGRSVLVLDDVECGW